MMHADVGFIVSLINRKKNVINEDIITKQLQYKVSISAELADWWCDGWFNDLVKIFIVSKSGSLEVSWVHVSIFRIEIII